MDPVHFDAIARTVATTDRRRVLRWLVAATVALLVGPSRVAAAPCPSPCRDDQVCQNGTCACRRGFTECNLLGPRCVNLQSDRAFCGDCQTSCAGDQICQKGTCGCPKGSKTLCENAEGDPHCTNLQTDRLHCGACGAACRGQEICRKGKCRCPTKGETTCDVLGIDLCVNLQTDSAFCGACDAACAPNHICKKGVCRCPSGKSSCVPTGSELSVCVAFQTDPNHCGGCNQACAANQTCKKGVCKNQVCAAASAADCGQSCTTHDDCSSDFCYTGCDNCGAGQCEWCDPDAGVCRPGCRSHSYCPDLQSCDMFGDNPTHQCIP
jgi:hypothetical protein